MIEELAVLRLAAKLADTMIGKNEMDSIAAGVVANINGYAKKSSISFTSSFERAFAFTIAERKLIRSKVNYEPIIRNNIKHPLFIVHFEGVIYPINISHELIVVPHNKASQKLLYKILKSEFNEGLDLSRKNDVQTSEIINFAPLGRENLYFRTVMEQCAITYTGLGYGNRELMHMLTNYRGR